MKSWWANNQVAVSWGSHLICCVAFFVWTVHSKCLLYATQRYSWVLANCHVTRKNIDMSIFADLWHRLRAGVNSYVNVFLNICHTSIEAAMPCRSVKGKREEGRKEKGRYEFEFEVTERSFPKESCWILTVLHDIISCRLLTCLRPW